VAERPSRKHLVSIAFQVVWMVFWLAGMIVGVYILGSTALEGEVIPTLFLVVWLGAAAVGLLAAARGLRARLVDGERVRRGPAPRSGTWSDGFSDRQDP
jgi:hypothetical protein